MRKTKSVLNTDSFDRRRYKEISQMSQKLKKLEKEGEKLLPSFPHLQGDIWASFYKMNPEIRNDVAKELETNKMLMEKIMSNETYQKHRDSTKLDDLTSAIACMSMADVAIKWIREMVKKDNNLHDMYLDKDIDKEVAKDFENKLKQVIQNEIETFNSHISMAVEEAKKTEQNLKDIVSGISPGSDKAELRKIPLRDKLALAEKLSGNQKIREIARWAGRMKDIARKKQKTKHNQSIERSGVGLGSMVERLLPSELAMYSHPATKLDFLRRFAEGQTMMYDPVGKESLGKGPIILCLDQSGSMEHLDTQAKGFALALMSIARKQKRDFALVLFDRRTIVYQFPKGKITPNDMVQLAKSFLGGGTYFEPPLKEAMEIIETHRFEKADVIFVTDGQATISDAFAESFDKTKQKKQYRMMSVLLGIHAEDTSLKKVSDEILHASDFVEAAEKTFTI